MQRLTAAVLLGLAGIAQAGDAFRCGSSIVDKDTSLEDLVTKCGEPDSKTINEEDVRAANAGGGTRKVGTTITETWTYERGTHAFAMVVTIVDGKIKNIASKP